MTAEANLAANYRDVRQQILSAASMASRIPPTLVAVSKTQPADAIEALYHLGHRDFGENYVQDLVLKATDLASRGLPEISWHFIGHLQTNKVKALLPHVACIHSVDSEKLAQEISKRATEDGRKNPVQIFLEVNVSGEPTKSGFHPSEIRAVAAEIAKLSKIELYGLMCIPAPGTGLRAFQTLRELETSCRPATSGGLSMGMTDDFELAIQEGATHVRVGTALFGPRPSNP